MKTKMILLVFCITTMLCMSACIGNTEISVEAATADTSIGDDTMVMKIDDTQVSVDWENNKAVEALKEMAKNGDITIQMSMYGGFEQVGPIGQNLPQEDVKMTTSAGDIVLYAGNQMVVFYGSNSWAYTKLGHISDRDEAEMAELLSNGDVTITISIDYKK